MFYSQFPAPSRASRCNLFANVLVTAAVGLPLLGISAAVQAAPAAALPAAATTYAATQKTAPLPTMPTETKAQRDARMKWWREAKFGLFIHWGVYSVPAGFYQGKPVGDIGEWIMNNAEIPVADYRGFARQFNPTQFDADAWVKLAKDAGMKYIVITSKHHDGFAMFDSKASPWNIVQASPCGRDPLKALAAACRKNGIRLGFYYSQAQDWNNPGGGAYKPKWDKAQEGDFDRYLDTVALPQMKEILSNYGPISVLWFDTPANMTPERAARFFPILKLQPNIIVNNRLGGDFQGDTETPEQFIPATGFPNRDWESCMTMNDTWGYKSDDHNWKSPQVLIHNLVDIASKGGNYLLNVGPTAQGLIPGPSIERLQAVGRWMKTNGEAIYATQASPFKTLAWGRCTQKADGNRTKLFLHVFDWPADGNLRVPGLTNAVRGARMLDGGKKLMVRSGPDGVTISLPPRAPDAISSTIVLEIKGAPLVQPVVLGQDAAGVLQLAAVDAVIHGSKLKYESGNGRDNLGYWIDAAEWAVWPAKITRPGRFKVVAEIAAETGGGRFEIVSGDQKLVGEAPATGGYTQFQTVELGTMQIAAAGPLDLAVHPIAEGWHPMNLKSLRLAPLP